jgi:hypothetical protein
LGRKIKAIIDNNAFFFSQHEIKPFCCGLFDLSGCRHGWTTQDFQIVLQASEGEGHGCNICTLIMTEIDTIIAADATEDAILEAILPICSYMPETLIGFCNSLIETNLHAIIDGLVHNQLSPEAVCGTLSLC